MAAKKKKPATKETQQPSSFSFKSTASNSDVKVATNPNKGLRQTVKSAPPSSDNLTMGAMLYMGLLALQFALQPVFSAKYSPGPGIDKTLIVMCTEFLKCCIAIWMLYVSSPTTKDFRSVMSTWTLQDWLKVRTYMLGLSHS
jgi:hypothetical protein